MESNEIMFEETACDVASVKPNHTATMIRNGLIGGAATAAGSLAVMILANAVNEKLNERRKRRAIVIEQNENAEE